MGPFSCDRLYLGAAKETGLVNCSIAVRGVDQVGTKQGLAAMNDLKPCGFPTGPGVGVLNDAGGGFRFRDALGIDGGGGWCLWVLLFPLQVLSALTSQALWFLLGFAGAVPS